MIKTTQQLIRSGNPITRVTDEVAAKDIVVFTFGVEISEVESCSITTYVVGSEEMCMFQQDTEEGYFSTDFSALQGKVEGKLVFEANLVKNNRMIKECVPPAGTGRRSICGNF